MQEKDSGMARDSNGLALVGRGRRAFEDDVAEGGDVRFVGQVGTEADAHVKGLVHVQDEGRAERMHGLTVHADEQQKSVAVLLDSDAPGHDDGADANGRLS